MSSATVIKIGDSLGFCVPDEDRPSWMKLGEKVEFEVCEEGFLIKPAHQLPTLHSLMKGYTGPKPEIVDTGLPLGREVWD